MKTETNQKSNLGGIIVILLTLIALALFFIKVFYKPESINDEILKSAIGAKQQPYTPQPQSAAPTQYVSPKYVKLLSITGNGSKNTKVIHLNGGDAKLVYKYRSDLSMGVFGIYVLPTGWDFTKQGGVPDVMVSSSSANDESSLQKPPGDYYIHINAYGYWKITVEEMQ